MDEATQVSGRKDSGGSSDWLHSVTKPLVDIAEVIDVELSASSGRSLPVPADSGCQLPVSASSPDRSKNVIRQIEDLENDIDNFLQAARFRTSEPEPEAAFQLSSRSVSLLSTSSSSAREFRTRRRMDSTTSTQYRQLPDHLTEFFRLTNPPDTEARKKSSSAELKYLFRNPASSGSVEPPGTGLSSIFELPRNPEAKESNRRENTSGGSQEPQTYFRDFNEILKMDLNPFPVPAGNSRQVHRPKVAFPDPPSAPFKIISAISSNASGQLDASGLPEASGRVDDVDRFTIQSKNGLGSRSAHDGASSTSSAPERDGQPETGITEFHPDSTVYMTLTPHYTSCDTTGSAMPGNDEDAEFRNLEANLSPIPRASSPMEHPHSGSEESGIRKQSTSASEYDRSIEERTFEDIRIPAERDMEERRRKPEKRNRKTEDLLIQLRTEIDRDESLLRSIQRIENINRIETSTPALPAKKFRIQMDPQVRSLLESQTIALQSIVQNMEEIKSGFRIPEAGSRAAIEVDRIRSQLTTESAQQYTSDFEPTSASAPTLSSTSRNE